MLARPDRRVRASRQHRPADRARTTRSPAQPNAPRRARVAEGFSDSLLGATRRRERSRTRSASRCWSRRTRCCWPTFPGADALSSGVPAALRVRRAQLELRRSARSTPDAVGVRRHRALSALGAGNRRRRRRPARRRRSRRRPRRCPTSRSLFLGFHYNFAKLPDEPMRPRARRRPRRLLHDASASTSRTTRRSRRSVNYVNRWRLEKKDPAAALSEPKQPIVFWLDRNVPRALPRRGARRHPRVEQGVRAHRLQGRDQVEDPARRRRLSTRSTPATRRCAG